MIRLAIDDEADLSLQVVSGQNTETIHLRHAMKINQNKLVDEFVNQPSWFAYYSALMVIYEDKHGQKKREQMRYQADLSLKIRTGKVSVTVDEKRLTEGAINAYIENDKGYVVLQDELDELQSIVKKLDVLVRASVQRKDMLINLGLYQRQEMKQANMT